MIYERLPWISTINAYNIYYKISLDHWVKIKLSVLVDMHDAENVYCINII